MGKFCKICSQDIERKRNSGVNQGPLLVLKCVKMMCNNTNSDVANMNAYIKFWEILCFRSQDIERKRTFGVNQGPSFWYKSA